MLLTAARAQLLSPQDAAVSSPQGSRQSQARRRGASGQVPRLALPPSSPTGPWPAGWRCCSWREVMRFSRLRGMKPTCTGGSLPASPRGSTPPIAAASRALSPSQLWSPQTPPQAQPQHFVGCRTDPSHSRELPHSPPQASLGQSLPEGALSESLTRAGSSPRQPSPRTELSPPHHLVLLRTAVGLGSLRVPSLAGC